MLSYLESIGLSGGDKQQITIICTTLGTILPELKQYLKKKNQKCAVVNEALPGIVASMYSECENRYYNANEIRDIIDKKVANYIKEKSKDVCIFIINTDQMHTINLDGIMKHLPSCNLYFINLNLDDLFDSLRKFGEKEQRPILPRKLISVIVSNFIKTDKSNKHAIVVIRAELKKQLLKCKYFFPSESEVDGQIDILFKCFSEPGDNMYLTFNCKDAKIIDAIYGEDMSKYFNEIQLP